MPLFYEWYLVKNYFLMDTATDNGESKYYLQYRSENWTWVSAWHKRAVTFQKLVNFYHQQKNFGATQYFYTCVSFCSQGGGICIQGGLHLECSASRGSASRGVRNKGVSASKTGESESKGGAGLHPRRWADPSQSDTAGYGQRTGGTHLTGMHSCLSLSFPRVLIFR